MRMAEVQARTSLILVFLALMVLFYFSGNYMLTPIIDTLHNEGIIPGTEKSWRLYAGFLKTVPGFIGLALTFLWGVLGDKLGRRKLLLVLGLTMGASLILVSSVTNYIEIMAYLIIFGIALLGISPVIYAFIADVVPSEKRGKGYATYYASSVFGMVLGLLMAGILLNWRVAYLLSGVLVIVFVAGLYSSSKGITIGYSDQESTTYKYSLREAVRGALTRSVLIMMIQVFLWTIPWGLLAFFSVDYIMTRWGLPRNYASLILILATISIAFGHIIGGTLSDRLARKKGPIGRVQVSIAGIAVGYAAMVAMLAYPYPYGVISFSALLPPSLLAIAGMMFTTFAYPNISTVISDCVKPEYRGTVFSIYNVLNGAGWALGPSLYGALVYYLLSAGTDKLTALLYSAVGLVSLWLLCIVAWVLLAKYYPADYMRVKGS